VGSAFQDSYMGSRPEYQELMARTRRFLPLPLSAGERAGRDEKLREARQRAEDTQPAAPSPAGIGGQA
jgi:hypothetical protein